jgi:formylglycine-generating enzyme required for sulfatase activity
MDTERVHTAAGHGGVLDLVGSVWQWTNEFQDEHTRAAIVRGGSSYQPQGAIWYFPQAYRNDQHSKLLLMSPGRNLLQLRCVKGRSSLP